MEDYKTLIEIVSDLVDKGYIVDFSPLENVMNGFQKIHTLNIPPEDFLIDEIYCCEDKNDEMAATYVFAISSKKHKFKGIVINALTEEEPITLSGIVTIIKNKIFNLLQTINHKINKHKIS